jgi:hypothetical protein
MINAWQQGSDITFKISDTCNGDGNNEYNCPGDRDVTCIDTKDTTY